MIHAVLKLMLGNAVLSFTAAAQVGMAPPGVFELSNLPFQKIGPDDLVGISIYGAPELSGAVRVRSDGTIQMPMVKKPIAATGLLPADIEEAIAAILKADRILNDPMVRVTVVEYRSRPIRVFGAVKRPVTFQASGAITLLDALSRAEGLTDEAGPEILISGPQGHGDNKDNTTQRILVKELIDAADAKLNLKLEGGEEIRVPSAGKVYAVGNIKRPGAFSIRDSRETSVLRVLALSEGLTPFAGRTAYIYRREGANGSRSEIRIELRKIMDRKSADVPLLPEDVLYIPDRTGRRATLSMIEKAFLTGSVLGAAAIYTTR